MSASSRINRTPISTSPSLGWISNGIGNIWPNIKNADLSRVLELAPGYGRNTARLARHAKEIHLVDVNQSCIDRCKQRFEGKTDTCKLFYCVNDGKSLNDLPSDYFTFVYSWDAMVHFDKLVIRDYIQEFHRILASKGGDLSIIRIMASFLKALLGGRTRLGAAT